MQGAAAAATSVSGPSWSWATRGRASALASRHVGLAAASSTPHFGPRGAAQPLPLLRVRGGCRLRPLSLLSDSGRNGKVTRAAASVPAEDVSAAEARTEDGGIAATVQLGAMIVAWYLLNIYFNIYNKQVLGALPLPLPYTITAFQLAFGSMVIFLMWATKLHPAPARLSAAQLGKIAPLAVGHMLGTVFTNMSLGKVAVSFTHTIKASEPFFTVLLSGLFLGEVPSLPVLGSLVPIVGGVALASLTEVSFNWSVLYCCTLPTGESLDHIGRFFAFFLSVGTQ
ncbi:hypothetical protein U9M48_020922 [Paspalum notatum var. saurae]|uniref:Sugar phosphate transporter domain-containing protein n=1 Tax=Paspalum notatum var. saurae TaxID=547442 RepID=A0AAQ3TJC1_PASNO